MKQQNSTEQKTKAPTFIILVSMIAITLLAIGTIIYKGY